MAEGSKSVLDHVIATGETVEIQRHGRTLAELNRKVGVPRAEFVRLMRGRGFTEAESRQLKQAMDAASEVFGYAGRD
jgi:ABC-type sugar transport system ATPase subunit